MLAMSPAPPVLGDATTGDGGAVVRHQLAQLPTPRHRRLGPRLSGLGHLQPWHGDGPKGAAVFGGRVLAQMLGDQQV
ncbi:uncharacterized protein PgNI_06968 [Pyricularia grisea]|uniref:Uncharacterized protein n=1 Tax=Pyricularia grisea TaxID=148305 RepID=A0A6P8B2Z4_PYRGI|nr:uncharacterized protein PgNI_06968 [Pyricularia grisea]TLD09236.1 hypothetical protein PgNI_06968 [Pyricularia grisea]